MGKLGAPAPTNQLQAYTCSPERPHTEGLNPAYPLWVTIPTL